MSILDSRYPLIGFREWKKEKKKKMDQKIKTRVKWDKYLRRDYNFRL